MSLLGSLIVVILLGHCMTAQSSDTCRLGLVERSVRERPPFDRDCLYRDGWICWNSGMIEICYDIF